MDRFTEFIKVPISLIEEGDMDKIKKLLSMIEGLLGRWAKHPEYGRVLCIWDRPNSDSKVLVCGKSPDSPAGSLQFIVSLSDLEFEPIELSTEKDFLEAPAGTVVENPNSFPLECDGYRHWISEERTWLPDRMAETGPWQVLRWGGSD